MVHPFKISNLNGQDWLGNIYLENPDDSPAELICTKNCDCDCGTDDNYIENGCVDRPVCPGYGVLDIGISGHQTIGGNTKCREKICTINVNWYPGENNIIFKIY